MHEFVPAEDFYVVTAAIKRLFDKHGNRKNRHAARLRFLWNTLGEERFRQLYEEQLQLIRAENPAALPIQDVQPRPVELWLRELPLSPKSKTHVRSLMHGLVEFATWAGMLDVSRNPVSLVRNIGATPEGAESPEPHGGAVPRSAERATRAIRNDGPAMRLLGLRIGEALALEWADVDWLGSRLSVRRGIVNQIVGDVKTQGPQRHSILQVNC